MEKWRSKNIQSLKGRTAIVTGVGGLGFEDARALAKAGATVILAGRSEAKGNEAVAMIFSEHLGADVSFEQLDLADSASIEAFARRMKTKLDSLDILINNAGVMTPPERRETKDGFELQFGTNYLGHFVLTRRLLPLLKKAKGRVISLSSVAARNGAIQLDDINFKKGYDPMRAYAQSKIACLLFAQELQRRSEANKWGITSIASHPGIARTNLFNTHERGFFGQMRTHAAFMFQPPAIGALPTLYAATSPDAKPGGYYGPNGPGETRGYPTEVRLPKLARDAAVASLLWELSEKLTKVPYPKAKA